MSTARDIKRRARRDLHRKAAVPALLIMPGTPTPAPVECRVRVWLKADAPASGDLPNFDGAQRQDPEDRIRFDLGDFAPSARPRRLGIVSVEAGEAYRIDHLYTVDLDWQTARVTRLSAEDAAGLPLPDDV